MTRRPPAQLGAVLLRSPSPILDRFTEAIREAFVIFDKAIALFDLSGTHVIVETYHGRWFAFKRRAHRQMSAEVDATAVAVLLEAPNATPAKWVSFPGWFKVPGSSLEFSGDREAQIAHEWMARVAGRMSPLAAEVLRILTDEAGYPPMSAQQVMNTVNVLGYLVDRNEVERALAELQRDGKIEAVWYRGESRYRILRSVQAGNVA